MKEILNGLGAWIVAALLSGCIDPGSGPVSANAPQSGSGGGRAATLSWEAPVSNTNGTPLMDLSGYRIYYGPSPEDLSHTVHIRGVGLQTYVIDDLGPGTWYFAVMALAGNGSESALSNVVAKTISSG